MGRTSLPLRLSLFAAFILASQGGADAAPTLAEAVREADAKYRDAPAIAGDDSAPKIEAGGGEAETAPTTREIAQGPIKAVLSYVEETGEDAEVMRTPAVTVFAESKEVAKLNGESIGFADPPVGVQIAELDGGNPYPEVVVSFSPEERIAAPPPAFSPQAPTARNGRRSISASSTAGPCSRPISTAMAATSS